MADEKLSPDEQTFVSLHLYNWSMINERLFHMAREGYMDGWIKENNLSLTRDVVSSPGFQAWYRDRGHWLGSEYRAEVEKLMGAGAYEPIKLSSE